LQWNRMPRNTMCDECETFFAHIWTLNRHILNYHSKQPNTRRDQSYEMHLDKPSLQSHKRRSDDEVKKYQCPSCTKFFTRKQGLKNHVDAFHLQKRHICNICGKSFPYKSTIFTHVNAVHKNGKIYRCPQCERFFYRGDDRNRHFQNVHEENKQLACTLCSLQFSRKVDFIRHMRFIGKDHSFIHFGLVVKTTRVCPDCFKLANTDHVRVDSESRHRLP
uniref:C2H2-type domain-containing protein n=1 Tax=Rodentolepis nana TaxID=102285 RepID=A0A0R3TEB2_RODNA